MTRGRFYATAMPIWAIVYAIGVVALHNHTFTVAGAMVFALIAVVGATVIRPDEGAGRDRPGRRDRRT